MIRGIGVDIVSNGRFDSFDEKFLKKIFTTFELEEGNKRANKSEYFASRFALKEAIVKAFGTGFTLCPALSIEIRERDSGEPYATVENRKEKVFVSLSHEKEYSVGFAVVLDES